MAKQQEKKSTTGRVRKKQQKSVPTGVVHVKATFNNTIVTITDLLGNVVSWASAGKSGFSGSRKSSGFAATVAAQKASKDAMTHGMREVEINICGSGAGRESAVKGVQSAGLAVTMIRDVTPIPHNGCRPRKKRRV
ncbi:MAG: 30S ribosomal protein S11 [Chlamydiales bacterium]